MFRLSQRADYGLILLSSFAAHAAKASRAKKAMEDKSSKFISISVIANKYKLSPKFLSQIAQDLKKAGILKAKEGTGGGYSLAKKPQEIKLIDILKILEGEFFEGKCFRDEDKCVCGAKGIWKEIKDQMQAMLSDKTIADLVSQVRGSTPKYS